MSSVEPHASAKDFEFFFSNCKCCFIYFFIVATDAFKIFATDFCVGGFYLVTSIFPLETVQSFLEYLFGACLFSMYCTILKDD